ncbi:unnamed protein product [Auanema sp. JU1783]|nr:unnamed protein product [Auanema sp. JU1783]
MARRNDGHRSWKRQTKHCCAICSDKASGKHYGVYSCEGCKGFFKRTIRKDMKYKCKETSNCLIDKRHRNRCQSCRFEKCMKMGMRKEAVQEERNATPPTVAEVITVPMPPIIDTKASTSKCQEYEDLKPEESISIGELPGSYHRQRLMDFAFQIPAFQQLPNKDQSVLIYNAYCELIICDLALDLYFDADQCFPSRYSSGFYRKLCVFVDKLGDLSIDKMMMGAIKLIFLLDHEAPNIKQHHIVEEKREKVYNCLLDHCLTESPKDPGLFTQLLLRISTIRSMASEHEDDIYKFCGKPMIEDFLISCNNLYEDQL